MIFKLFLYVYFLWCSYSYCLRIFVQLNFIATVCEEIINWCNDSHLLSYLPFSFSACQSKDKSLQILLVFVLYPAMIADND